MQRDFLPNHYLSDFAKENIVGSVHVEALWDPADPVGETAWLETIDKSQGVAARYVAGAPLGAELGAEIIRRQATYENVVGIRGIISHHPVNGSLSFTSRSDLAYDEHWRRDVAAIHAEGLHLELMMYPYQAQAVSDLARAFPTLRIVINHCGSPIDRDEEGLRRWRDGLALVAQNPNVALKISNIGAYDPKWTLNSIKMIVDGCLQAFGTDRCLFGTDYPVANLNMDVSEIYLNFKKASSSLSAREQRALFHDNAAKFYRFRNLTIQGGS